MLLIITALYCEAKPFIEHYQLVKDKAATQFCIYENNEILLLITGPGSIAAAVGVAYLCTNRPIRPSDYLVNVGSCGASEKDIATGSIFLCNKLVEGATGRCFYPDILYRHPFAERELVTESTVRNITHGLAEGRLFDMEGAAIYQAAVYFIRPHRLSFLKIVSDHGALTKDLGEGKTITPEAISNLIEYHMEDIKQYLAQLNQAGAEKEPIFTSEEEAIVKELVCGLHCSATMEHRLRQYLHYYKILHASLTETVREYFDGTESCQSKKEGIKYIEKFRDRLI